ncbi:efflux transporter outer membrane subunit [Herbaspirillum sp. CF444]|uniref:efflux transporter outer membrane subunit n=1 Tax=Herbaspirillum sp. CF444 TaxID=1144319 RepID=UPI00307AEBC3
MLAATFGTSMAGCSMQPPYQAPAMPIASTWHAERPHGGSTQALVNWWASFDDPAVAELIGIAEANSPDLAKAIAQIKIARATLASDSAALLPTVTGTGSVSRSKQSVSTGDSSTSVTSTSRSGELDASWEIDLFGKNRSSRESAYAQLQASVDDWHDARVSLAAEVADDYVQYRGCKLLLRAYRNTAASQSQTLNMTRIAVSAGFSAESDGYLADASAASAAATATGQHVSCEELVKSLVAVTGADETIVRGIIDRSSAPALPEPASFDVSSVPADLIRQRPDLASAERTLASYYAAIGEARADRFPSLSLSGSIGLSATNASSPASTWSFGPSLSVPIFDAGKKKAAVDSALASYDKQLASYQSSVRSAVKAVEQALIDLNGAARQSEDSKRSADQYQRYANTKEQSWSAGLDTLLTLEDARRSAISAEVTLIGQRRDRVRYWIALYKALGGGWEAENNAAPQVAVPTPALYLQGSTQ